MPLRPNVLVTVYTNTLYITKQGQTWGQDRRCGDCHLTIHSRDEYIQHLGVTHRHVLQVSIF